MNALVAISIAVCAVAEAPVDVTVTVDPPVFPFHRVTRFTIAVEAADGAAIEFPQMGNVFGGLASARKKKLT